MIFFVKLLNNLLKDQTEGVVQLSIDQAKAFCAVVEHGGYAKAATALHKSHSSLIYMIKTLESQCSIPLFDRQSYRNKLTPQGRRIYEKCSELLLQVNSIANLCTQMSAGWEPSLKIVYDGSLPFSPFIKIYSHFRKMKIPTVVQTYANYLEDVEADFTGMKADLMLSIMPVDVKGLDFIRLKKQKSHLVAHRDHQIHHSGRRLRREDLHHFDFLTIRGSGKKMGLDTFEMEESASFFFSDFHVKKEAIMRGLGFGWLPEHLIERELKAKQLHPVRWEGSSTHDVHPTLYFSRQKSRSPALQTVIDFISTDA